MLTYSVCIHMTCKDMYIYQYVAHNSKPCKFLTSEWYKQLPPFVNSASYVQTHMGV